jgi:hypothetical protein
MDQLSPSQHCVANIVLRVARGGNVHPAVARAALSELGTISPQMSAVSAAVASDWYRHAHYIDYRLAHERAVAGIFALELTTMDVPDAWSEQIA